MCLYWWSICTRRVCHFTSLHSQLINDFTVPLSYFCFCIFSVCVGHLLSFLPPLRFQNCDQCYECSQTLSFQYVFLGSRTKCSDVQIYAIIFFTDILLIFSYCSLSEFFIITRNQYQCDKIQNCINCSTPKISYRQLSFCSLKCWKQPRDIPHNMQIIGCVTNSNIFHNTPGL